MNRQKVLKILVVFIIILLAFIYILNIFFRITDKNDVIKSAGNEIENLKKSIKVEKKIQKEIKQKGDLESIYFIREENYFEKYIRDLFDKYNVNMKVYHSKINEENYSELEISFKINAFDFFKLINDIENNKKIIIIKKVSIKKDKEPFFKISMKLGGYYKE